MYRKRLYNFFVVLWVTGCLTTLLVISLTGSRILADDNDPVSEQSKVAESTVVSVPQINDNFKLENDIEITESLVRQYFKNHPDVINSLTEPEETAPLVSEADNDAQTEVVTDDLEDAADEVISVEDEVIEPLEEVEETEATEPKSITEWLSEEELDLLYRTVEAEATGGNMMAKANVCSVIFNRIGHSFGKVYGVADSIIEVIKEPGQFMVITNGRYKKMEITQSTIDACEYVYQHGDTTGGCLFFDSRNGDSWAGRHRKFAFRDSIGHDFYY